MEPYSQAILAALNDFFAYPFLQSSLLALLAVGFVCSLLSCMVVLRRMAFMGQGIAYSSFGGYSLAIWLFPALAYSDWRISAVIAIYVICAALLIGWISRTGRIPADSAIGVILAVSTALGLFIFSGIANQASYFEPFLFGSVLAVSQMELIALILWLILVMLFAWLYFRDLAAMGYDENYAATVGLPVGFTHYALILILALTVLLSVKIAGVVLTSAFLIVPGAFSRLIARRFSGMVGWSIALGILSAGTGFACSLLVAWAPVAVWVIAIQCGVFLIALVFHRVTGSI
jgi:ABC-type Mn2+/Zn2+ transport system permease subunit